MAGFVKRAFADRIGGKRPSVARSMIAAAAAGAVAAGVTYRVLRA